MIAELIGGLGLFMLGMILLTDGLHLLAGEALRSWLQRFTRGPLSSVITGAVGTSLVQSSSAITLLVIGFVNARLLTFAQALGVVYGANLGTTTTAWAVALLGFRVDMGEIALPMVAAGALLRLMARGRAAAIGTAIAGFGVIFVGIDVLQGGMTELVENVQIAGAPSTFAGRLSMVGLGTVMTVVMQSSSAAVAATLTALHTGAIDLEQATALVVGHNIGTTVTALMAATGGSASAKRTALAHVLFNVVTGALAVAALPMATGLLAAGQERWLWSGVTALATFHTCFNLAGVLLFLPITKPFAALLGKLVPERSQVLVRRLDRALLASPRMAVSAARHAAADVAGEVARVGRRLLGGAELVRFTAARLEVAEGALSEVRAYLAKVNPRSTNSADGALLHVLHALDHLQRLLEACRELRPSATAGSDRELSAMGVRIGDALEPAETWFDDPGTEPPTPIVARVSQGLAETRRGYRLRLLEQTALGEVTPETAEQHLEAIRWMDRLAYHLWRALVHLSCGDQPDDAFQDGETGPPGDAPEPESASDAP